MPVNAMQTSEHRTDHASNGGRLVTVDGRLLPLESARLQAMAGGGLARTILTQVFGNPYQEPLQVVYTMPLPADGAISGYEFRLGERRITGEVKQREAARHEFERALVEGRTAGLLEQERANLFTQQLGNLPPGRKVTVDLAVDQKLAWIAEGMWEWRFPTVSGPRYLGAEGRVPDAGRVTVEVGDGGLPVRATMELSIGDRLTDDRGPESPSHSISIRPAGCNTCVCLSPEQGARLDRDVVVRWAVPRPRPGVTLQSARHKEAAYGLLTIVPPASTAATLPRDLILLIDTSGSMHGDPLRQAKRVARALIDSLRPADSLEMIAFSGATNRWRRGAVEMSDRFKLEAHGFIDGLQAGGGTEMRSAVEEALRPLRADGVRQVILLTDGYIGFEAEVIAVLRRHLPAGSRLHAVGVGLAVNGALLRPAARAGRGVEVIVGLDEDAERGAARLLAATREPVVSDIVIGGDAVTGLAPRALPDLLAGAPVLASVMLRSEGGRITVGGRTAGGTWEQEVVVPPAGDAEADSAIARLYAREAVEDLEIYSAAGGDRRDIDAAIERFGIDFQIATRLTSWVALSEQLDVDPRAPSRRSIIPQELPYGTSPEGLGLRPVLPAGAASVRTHILGRAVDEAVTLDAMPPMEQSEPPSIASAAKYWSKLSGGTALAREPRQSFDDEPGARAQSGRISTGREAGRVPVETRTFRGRFIDAGLEDIQMIEFEVTGENLDWHPLERVTLQLRDGSSDAAAIDVTQGTMSGEIKTGCLVRLALTMDRSEREAVVAVRIDSGSMRIRIEL